MKLMRGIKHTVINGYSLRFAWQYHEIDYISYKVYNNTLSEMA